MAFYSDCHGPMLSSSNEEHFYGRHGLVHIGTDRILLKYFIPDTASVFEKSVM